jgi:hypothetical protein
MDCENFSQGNNQNSCQNLQANPNPQHQQQGFFPPTQNPQQPAYAQQTNQFWQAPAQQQQFYGQQAINSNSFNLEFQNPASIQNLSQNFQQMSFSQTPFPSPQNQIPHQNFDPFPTPQNQIANGANGVPQQIFNPFFPDQNSIQQSFAQGQNYEPVKPAKNIVKRTYNMRNSTKAKKQA